MPSAVLSSLLRTQPTLFVHTPFLSAMQDIFGFALLHTVLYFIILAIRNLSGSAGMSGYHYFHSKSANVLKTVGADTSMARYTALYILLNTLYITTTSAFAWLFFADISLQTLELVFFFVLSIWNAETHRRRGASQHGD
jgi:hypothetical protein